ncbi:MAG: DNA methyltransferase [Rhodospirillaceae bacterium]|nr:DNA methyltransferase [Rhodospirillaceae bacterium]
MDSATVDLIATDPPFNKARDFHATPESLAAGATFQDRWSWDRDVHEEWTDQITDDHPRLMEAIESARHAHSDSMGAYMCFMAVRLLEMRRVLKPTGSIYLHCDPTASHYLKACMDAIFGHGNFRNEIVWRIGWMSGFKTQKRGWIRNHDIILYYVASPAAAKRFNKKYLPYPPGYVRRDGKPPTGKGIPIEDTWNCSEGDRLDSLMIKSFAKKTGFPTEKTLGLYERIVRASSKPGEIVLDPFAGCATTCVAAEKHGRQWLGIDIWDKAHGVVIDRLKEEGMLRGPGEGRSARLAFGDITSRKSRQSAATVAIPPPSPFALSSGAPSPSRPGSGYPAPRSSRNLPRRRRSPRAWSCAPAAAGNWNRRSWSWTISRRDPTAARTTYRTRYYSAGRATGARAPGSP